MSPRRSNVDNFRESILTDSHAQFERPRRRTRPRTKERPDYSELPLGLVVTIDRGRYRCLLLDADGVGRHEVICMKARTLGRKAIIVGDRVRLDGDTSGAEGTLARIVEAMERTTVLRRTADDDDPYERPIVANADQLVIVTALADPPPRTGMIDRILVAAYDAGLDPLLCLTKADLAAPDELIAAYEPLGVPIVVTRPGAPLTDLWELLEGRSSVLIGHSGVGKSTLINTLIPDAGRATGDVNEVTGRGRHTSTSAIALQLPEPHTGWVIDTPGVRSFGLSHVTPDKVISAFPDLASWTDQCPRGCTHELGVPGCGLDRALELGGPLARRVESFRRMMSARSRGDQQ